LGFWKVKLKPIRDRKVVLPRYRKP
jgi:hypothetical protein